MAAIFFTLPIGEHLLTYLLPTQAPRVETQWSIDPVTLQGGQGQLDAASHELRLIDRQLIATRNWEMTLRHLYRNWTFHNVIAHPALALLQLIGLPRAASWVHDITVPTEESQP